MQKVENILQYWNLALWEFLLANFLFVGLWPIIPMIRVEEITPSKMHEPTLIQRPIRFYSVDI